MKNYNYFLPALLISLLIASCSGEKKESTTDTTDPEIIQPQATDQATMEQQQPAGDQIQPVETAPVQSQPIQVNPSQVNPQMQQQVQPAGKVMAGMNPEHGQP